jgi:hypothetical protein
LDRHLAVLDEIESLEARLNVKGRTRAVIESQHAKLKGLKIELRALEKMEEQAQKGGAREAAPRRRHMSVGKESEEQASGQGQRTNAARGRGAPRGGGGGAW